jgi:hypothetical protein
MQMAKFSEMPQEHNYLLHVSRQHFLHFLHIRLYCHKVADSIIVWT